jgi:benzodiazapine receptor
MRSLASTINNRSTLDDDNGHSLCFLASVVRNSQLASSSMSIMLAGKRVAFLAIVVLGVLSISASAFTPTQTQAFSFSRPYRPSSCAPATGTGTPSTTTTTTITRTTSLQAFPSPLVSAIGHALGGTLGTPIVIGATKKGGWYRNINLPEFTPPDRIFAPVWTTLYSCMGVAIARIASRVTTNSFPIVQLWFAHYALNSVWASVFFGAKKLRLGLFINFVLLASLGAIIPLYYQIDKLAALLLLPYLAWLAFATFLNFTICKLNPTRHGYNNAMFQDGLIKLQTKARKFAFNE